MRLGLILGEALNGLRRNASMVISVVLVTFVSLTFVGAAMLMQMQIGKMQEFWVDRAQVAVYMCSTVSETQNCSGGLASDDQVQAVRASLEGGTLAPYIRDFTFEDNQQAFDRTVELLGAEYAAILTPDQVSATFSINLVDQGQSDLLTEAFGGFEGVDEVQDQMAYLEPLFSALTIASYVAIGIATLMLIAAVLLIATTIRLSAFARRREIGIMRLVGASNRFIQTPFVLEGVFAALIGSALASATIWAIVNFGVDGYLRSNIVFITAWVGPADLTIVIPVIVVVGAALAALSAGFAIRRWLRT